MGLLPGLVSWLPAAPSHPMPPDSQGLTHTVHLLGLRHHIPSCQSVCTYLLCPLGNESLLPAVYLTLSQYLGPRSRATSSGASSLTMPNLHLHHFSYASANLPVAQLSEDRSVLGSRVLLLRQLRSLSTPPAQKAFCPDASSFSDTIGQI